MKFGKYKKDSYKLSTVIDAEGVLNHMTFWKRYKAFKKAIVCKELRITVMELVESRHLDILLDSAFSVLHVQEHYQNLAASRGCAPPLCTHYRRFLERPMKPIIVQSRFSTSRLLAAPEIKFTLKERKFITKHDAITRGARNSRNMVWRSWLKSGKCFWTTFVHFSY